MGRNKSLPKVTILQALPSYDKEFSYMYSYVKEDREYFLVPNTIITNSVRCEYDDLINRKRDHRIFNEQEE